MLSGFCVKPVPASLMRTGGGRRGGPRSAERGGQGLAVRGRPGARPFSSRFITAGMVARDRPGSLGAVERASSRCAPFPPAVGPTDRRGGDDELHRSSRSRARGRRRSCRGDGRGGISGGGRRIGRMRTLGPRTNADERNLLAELNAAIDDDGGPVNGLAGGGR